MTGGYVFVQTRPLTPDPLPPSARQVAFLTLRAIHRGTYADVALDRALRKHRSLSPEDRRFVTELVYGCTRRMRSLDALLDGLGRKSAQQQSPDFRTLLHLGLYQLAFLDRVPPSAAVDTTVDLAKHNRLRGLTGVVNGMLRSYARQQTASGQRFGFALPADPVDRLGVRYSFPNWIIEQWIERLGFGETEQLCQWFDRSPSLDLRVNRLRAEPTELLERLRSVGVTAQPLGAVPDAIRLEKLGGEIDRGGEVGVQESAIARLPGFTDGAWSVQDGSAQLVTWLLDPQPEETIIDACAAPGGKTTHIAERMGDRGRVWALDRTTSRLKKLRQSVKRLGLTSIRAATADCRAGVPLPAAVDGDEPIPTVCDRLLLDVPCSGLGTLHRRADARWRQTPATVAEIVTLQRQLLARAADWVRPGGVAVYATCTIHGPENGAIVREFLDQHPNWEIEVPPADSPLAPFCTDEGCLEIWPHRWQMDGFFAVRLRRRS